MSDGGNPFGGLYRDLRDRHLLPVIAVLAVAIVAVPVVLKSEPEAVPPAAPAADTGEASEAVPAVMVDSEGIRDYRKRLDVLRSKNPFTDHFAPPPSPVDETGAVDLSLDGTTPDAGFPAETPTSSPSAVVPFPDTSTESSTTTTNTDIGGIDESTTTTTTDTGGTQPAEIITKEYRLSYRADVLVGPAGQAQKQEDVKMLSFLPSRQRPVAVFVGVTEDDERAVFMVSTDVTGSAGDGQCSPSAVNCQFVTLKEGERRTLTYAPEGKPAEDFTLELTGVDLAVVEEGDDAIPDDADRNANSASVPSGMAAWLGLGG